MAIDILWNSGTHQILGGVKKIIELDDKLIISAPYNMNICQKNIRCYSCDIQSITILNN